MIRVIHFVATLGSPGGVQSLLKNYYERMDHEKVHFDFAVFDKDDHGFQHFFTEMGCNIFYVPPKKNGLKEHVDAIRKIFEDGHYDIVHTHQNFRGALTIWEAKRCGIPVRIVHSHRSNAPESIKVKVLRYFITKWIKRISTDWWACGHDAGIWMFGEKAVKSGKVHILNNAIDLSKYSYNEQVRNDVRKEFGFGDSLVIGNVARFTYQKNHHLLIDIFEKYHAHNSNSTLMLIGDGELENNVKELVRSKQIEDSVLFLGPRSDVPRLLQSMDLFALTSRFEGLPVVLVEAQCAGVPCVTSNNVTDEMAVTDLVSFVEKNASINDWIKMISFTLQKQRKTHDKELKIRGYDISIEATKLEDYYQGLINKIN